MIHAIVSQSDGTLVAEDVFDTLEQAGEWSDSVACDVPGARCVFQSTDMPVPVEQRALTDDDYVWSWRVFGEGHQGIVLSEAVEDESLLESVHDRLMGIDGVKMTTTSGPFRAKVRS